MKKPELDIFNDASREIFHLMETDSFKRFRSDPMAERLLKRLEHRDFWNPAAYGSSPGTIRGSNIYKPISLTKKGMGTLRISAEKTLRRKIDMPVQNVYEPYFKAGWLTKQGGGKGGRKNW